MIHLWFPWTSLKSAHIVVKRTGGTKESWPVVLNLTQHNCILLTTTARMILVVLYMIWYTDNVIMYNYVHVFVNIWNYVYRTDLINSEEWVMKVLAFAFSPSYNVISCLLLSSECIGRLSETLYVGTLQWDWIIC